MFFLLQITPLGSLFQIVGFKSVTFQVVIKTRRCKKKNFLRCLNLVENNPV